MSLNAQQLDTLRAALDRIIPADDYPGAWEAGVGEYIVRQLDGDLAQLAETYQQGLNSLETEALATHSASFVNLSPEQQDALLRNIEAETTGTSWPISPPRFFNMLVNHCAEGYYSDPGNGGNRDKRSWEMIGFDQQFPLKS